MMQALSRAGHRTLPMIRQEPQLDPHFFVVKDAPLATLTARYRGASELVSGRDRLGDGDLRRRRVSTDRADERLKLRIAEELLELLC